MKRISTLVLGTAIALSGTLNSQEGCCTHGHTGHLRRRWLHAKSRADRQALQGSRHASMFNTGLVRHNGKLTEFFGKKL